MARPSPNEDIAAVRAALHLAAVPARCRQLGNGPLPDGLPLLLRIPAGGPGGIEASAKCLQKPPQKLREAAAFYIEQIILAPNADSYRVLGARRSAATPELRRNFAFLCKWLHSGLCQDMARSTFFLRITHAWNNLKTPERRAAYDAALDARSTALAVSRNGRAGHVAKDQRPKSKVKPPSDEIWGRRGGQVRIAQKHGRINLWRRLIAFTLGSRRLSEREFNDGRRAP